jgi:hypothetical protein
MRIKLCGILATTPILVYQRTGGFLPLQVELSLGIVPIAGG